MKKLTKEGMLYLSHGASGLNEHDEPEWFIVEPRDNPEEQVRSLIASRRTVYEIKPLRWLDEGSLRKLRIPWS